MHVDTESSLTAASGNGVSPSMSRLSEIIQLGQITFALVITLLILAWFTVGARVWVRLRLTKTPGWDDFTMIITLILFTCYCSFILVITVESSKIHTMANFLRSIVYIQLGEIFYILTTTALKISLGLFFLRVLTKRWQVVTFHTILAVSAVYGLIYAFLTLFQCGNPAKLADRVLGSEKCLSSSGLLGAGYLYGVINILADWIYVLIPIVILVDSDMDRRDKISVGFVMGLGAVGSISSIMRLVYLKGLNFGPSGLSPNAIKATIWAIAEPGTGIIASSIAILRPLFRQINTEVRDKVSEYRSGKSSRGESRYQDTRAQDGDSMIALTSVVVGDYPNAKKASMYSVRSEDPWSPTITVGHAQIGQMINVKMATEKGLPPLPTNQ